MTVPSLARIVREVASSGSPPPGTNATSPPNPGPTPAHAHLSIREITKRFGGNEVLRSVSLNVQPGEIVSLLGPSGCGKTTLLRIVAGLTEADSGSVRLGGRSIDHAPPCRRNIGVVFQNYALFPHLSVGDNVAFSLKARGIGKAERRRVMGEQLARVRMAEFTDRPVRSLSGGQQQRVAVARALAMQPDLLLFDEPFSALDRQLREAMQVELKRLLREVGTSAVFVTHDQEEALQLSDRMALMNRGHIEQFDSPATVYARPRNLFALTFVGQSTRLLGTVAQAHGRDLLVDTAVGKIRGMGNFVRGAAVTVAVRPEHVRLFLDPARERLDLDDNAIACRVAEVSFKGPRSQVRLESASNDEILADCAVSDAADVRPGQQVTVAWDARDTLIVPADRGFGPQAES